MFYVLHVTNIALLVFLPHLLLPHIHLLGNSIPLPGWVNEEKGAGEEGAEQGDTSALNAIIEEMDSGEKGADQNVSQEAGAGQRVAQSERGPGGRGGQSQRGGVSSSSNTANGVLARALVEAVPV